MPRRCARCNKLLKEQTLSGLGPDCERVAWAEIESFCQSLFGMSWTEFADGCMEDFAGDNDQTLDEYKAENGDYGKQLWWAVESMMNHGLWSLTRKERR
jgi:threonine synthase